MPKLSRSELYTAGIVLLCILTAYLCRLVWVLRVPGLKDLAWLGLVRSALYFGLFIWWCISIRRRILQLQVRGFLTAIAVLMMFWFAVRTVKFFLVSDPDVIRQLWYLYYFPMLFIPMLGFLVALSLGRPEQYRLPRWTALLYFITALLVLLVLTNDLHQRVFVFLHEPSDDPDRYAAGYWMAVGWEYLCALSVLVTLFMKCRRRESRKMIWLPFVPVAASVAYGIAYYSGARWLRAAFGDMTVVQCLLIIATLECCIQSGLILSNTRYTELFRRCSVRAQITDPDYQVILASETASSYSASTLRQTEEEPVLLPNGIRLSGAPIHGGHVVWEDDVSELTLLTQKLADTHEQLADRNVMLAEELKTRRHLGHLAEQNRLYNEMQTRTVPQVRRLAALTAEFAGTEDPEQEKQLLARMGVLGAYLKRRSNLIFLAQQQGSLPAAELFLCLQESLQNLELIGIAADQLFLLEGELPFTQIMWFYDSYEQILGAAYDTLTELFVRTAYEENSAAVLRMRLCCHGDLAGLHFAGLTVSREDAGEWLLILRAPEGGGMV